VPKYWPKKHTKSVNEIDPRLTLSDDQNVTSIPSYGRKLSKGICKEMMSPLSEGSILHFLSDGHLYVDNGQTADTFDEGFCLDLFIDKTRETSIISAIVCVKPLLSFPSPRKGKGIGSQLCKASFDHEIFYKKIRQAYIVAGLISQVFLSITLFLYMTLPDLKNFQGKLITVNLFLIFLTTFLVILMYNIQPGVNFIKILRAAFESVNPKSVKRYLRLD
jgi:hypothetical protein